jgi:hypothetical protein
MSAMLAAAARLLGEEFFFYFSFLTVAMEPRSGGRR